MLNSFEKKPTIDQRLESESERFFLKNTKAYLTEMGFGMEDVSNINLRRVDHFHANCFAIHFGNNPEPRFIAKFLDPEKGWDVKEEDVRREHDVGFFVSNIVPELKPRRFSGWFEVPGANYPVVLYDYLGQAATYVESPEQTLAIVEETMPLLSKLHMATISEYYGASLDPDIRKIEHAAKNIGSDISRYLINDILRENLDRSGEIVGLINDRWVPVLSNKLFTFTHKDITLSNILLRDSRVNSIIDWTYSGWSDPANDIAYLLFWAMIRGMTSEARDIFERVKNQYNAVGLRPEKTLPFFLAFKCIEYGRFVGKKWVEVGRKILESNSVERAFSILSATHP